MKPTTLIQTLARLALFVAQALNSLQPVAALLDRLYVDQVFFLSGLTKIRDWDITLSLFMDEYKVPLLPPALAAMMGTAGELVLPVLLVLGLGGRFAAVGLSVVNVVAVVSLAEIAPAALQQPDHELTPRRRLANQAWANTDIAVHTSTILAKMLEDSWSSPPPERPAWHERVLRARQRINVWNEFDEQEVLGRRAKRGGVVVEAGEGCGGGGGGGGG